MLTRDAVVGRWNDERAASARQVRTGSTTMTSRCSEETRPHPGWHPPAPEETGHSGVTESSAEQTRFCVKCRQGDKGEKPLRTAQHDRVVLQTSVCELSASNSTDQAGQQASSLPATGPSGPGPSGPASKSLPEGVATEWSRPSGLADKRLR